MSEPVDDVWEKRLARERNARKEAERLLEKISLDLYNANQALRDSHEALETRVAERTLELAEVNDMLRREAAQLERLERSLLDNERQTRNLALVASRTVNAVVITDAEGRIEWVNEGFERITEFKLSEVLGRTPGSFLQGPETDPKVVSKMRDCIRKGEAFTAEVQNYTKSGHAYMISMEIQPFHDPLGTLTNFMAIETDVTQQRKIEQDLRESEQRFRTLADSAPVMIWMTDLKRRPVYFNRTWLEFTGRSLREETRSGWVANIHPEDRARFLDIYGWSFDRRSSFRLEYRLLNAEGEYRWILDTGAPRLTPEGKVEGYIGSCIDITDRKQAEETRRQLFALVEHSNDFIAMTTTEGQTFYLNPAGRAVAGLTSDAPILPARFEDLLNEEGRALFRDVGIPTALKQEQWWGEAAIRNLKTGEEVAMQHHLFLVHQEGSNRPLCLATIARDIAASKEVETKLRRAREDAEDASRAKSAFLANMSHELRTPMAAVVGFGELLMNPSLPKATRDEALRSISRNGRHLMQLIEDILDLSKIEAGRMELELSAYSPAQILEEARLIMHARATDCGIKLKAKAVGRIPAMVLTDATRVRQIVLNFTSNAIKFTDPGRRVSIRLFSENENDPQTRRFGFEVEDEGIGMSAEQLQLLFQPFMQLDTSPTRKFAGTGLGLSICKHLSQALGGEIKVSSVEGKGSRFSIHLPIHPTMNGLRWISAEDINHQHTNEPPSSMPVPVSLRGRILIAEDSPDLSRLLHYQLTGAGLEVDTAENGREAVEKALAKSYDIILMDMQMPVMDGYEAVKELRARGYKRPILALTAHAMRQDRERCIQAGCTEYQAKPVDLPTLMGILDFHLGSLQTGDLPSLKTATPKVGNPRVVKPERTKGRLFTAPAVAENDPAFLELVREYAADLSPKLLAIDEALMQGDLHRLAGVAHQIRGSGGMYGFNDLTILAGELEDQARGRRPGIELTKTLESLKRMAKGIIEEFGTETGGPI